MFVDHFASQPCENWWFSTAKVFPAGKTTKIALLRGICPLRDAWDGPCEWLETPGSPPKIWRRGEAGAFSIADHPNESDVEDDASNKVIDQ